MKAFFRSLTSNMLSSSRMPDYFARGLRVSPSLSLLAIYRLIRCFFISIVIWARYYANMRLAIVFDHFWYHTHKSLRLWDLIKSPQKPIQLHFDLIELLRRKRLAPMPTDINTYTASYWLIHITLPAFSIDPFATCFGHLFIKRYLSCFYRGQRISSLLLQFLF